MMKKLSLLAVLLCAALTMTSCATQENRSFYEEAQLYLGCGEYESAAMLFSQLGEYADSAEYTLYAEALQAIDEEKYALARVNLQAVAPFKSSARYLAYLDALEAEAGGDLKAALALYQQLGTFADAHLAAERLETAIPEAAIKEGRTLMTKGEYAAAREIFLSLEGYGASAMLAENCTVALNKAAYSAADELCKTGDHRAAMEAFTALGDTLDAAKRASDCLKDIHAELDAQYAAVTLGTAPALMAAYAELGEDATAQARIEELSARYGRNLEVVTAAEEHPHVLLGQYPTAESGEEHPVCWQVLKADGAVLTLVADTVLDASDAAETIALMFSEAEAAAVSEVLLPSVADLTALTDLTCTATPYALAQGAGSENGAALYWLRDSLESGLHPIIGASGALTLPDASVTPGIRPMMRLSLEQYAFTHGSGTAEDPFRVE